MLRPKCRFFSKSRKIQNLSFTSLEIQQIPIYSLFKVDQAFIIIYNLFFLASNLFLYRFLKNSTENNTALTTEDKGSCGNEMNEQTTNQRT